MKQQKNYRAPVEAAQAGTPRKTSPTNFFAAHDRWERALLIGPLGATDKLVGLVLLEHANRRHFDDTGNLEAWPSEDTLGILVGRSRRSVQSSVARLIVSGVVACLRQGRRNVGTSRYRFSWDWLGATETLHSGAVERWPDQRLKGTYRAQKAAPCGTLRAQVSAPQGATSRIHRAQKAAPNHSDDQIENHPDRARARARGGKGFDRRKMRPKGCATAALDDVLADLAVIEEEEATHA